MITDRADLPYPLGRNCCGAPNATVCHQLGLCWMEGVHPDSPGYRPAAPVVQGDEGLREAIARHLHGLHNPDRFWHAEWADHTQDYAAADAVLALPEVRQLAADAAAVKRVRAAIERHADNLSETQRAAFRRALDGACG